ncbi:cysteine hydrolase family protein [Phaeacidiphilus oryzae]|uniref:cysteine hydrolase family protein n=1 Tax=Phaeacidiphilus oryzae TaxID=348818 RepID=UPI00068AC623|nr:isochorismatase family cysteine hydrolase [Phaeacidiphilus oryzae]
MPTPSAAPGAAGATALLVMDVQHATVGRLPDADAYLARLGEAVGAARTAGVPVIHIVLGFRPGHPEVHPRNVVFSALPADALVPGDPNGEIHPAVAPLPGELVVTKNRVGAFTGNNLDQLLAAAGIEHLVLTGIATGGVVLATAVQAFDRDYRLTVLSDGCADLKPEFHEALLAGFFAKRGTVSTVRDWADSLS